MKKCPSSIQCRESNSLPLDHESPPTTTRPGLPPYSVITYLIYQNKNTSNERVLKTVKHSSNIGRLSFGHWVTAIWRIEHDLKCKIECHIFSRTGGRDRRLGKPIFQRRRSVFHRQISAAFDVGRTRRQIRALERGRQKVARLDQDVVADVIFIDVGVESDVRVGGAGPVFVGVIFHVEICRLGGRT